MFIYCVTSVSSDWIQLQDAVKTPEICTCCFHNEDCFISWVKGENKQETLKSCSKQEKNIVIGTGSRLNQTFYWPHVHKWMSVSLQECFQSSQSEISSYKSTFFFFIAELMSDYYLSRESWQSTIVYKVSSNAIRRAIMLWSIIIIKHAAGNLADLLVWGIVHALKPKKCKRVIHSARF